MTDTVERTLKFIKKHSMIRKGSTVLIAFSGGPDSTALLLMLCELRNELDFKLAAAHFNHCIRKNSSDMDEEFCRRTSEKLGVPFYSKREDVISFGARTGASIETAARLLRYRFLYDTAKSIGASSIATAHHAEDNAESILMHIIRGTGLAGLCGIRPRSERDIIPLTGSTCDGVELMDDYSQNIDVSKKIAIIRPLLEFEKKELLEYLDIKGMDYCVDETNSITGSSRNILRLKVIPEIAGSINTNAVKNILRLGEIASEDDGYLSELAFRALDEARNENGYDAKKLNALPLPIKKRAIRLALLESNALIDAEQTHIEAICALLKKQSGTGIDLPSARARMVFGSLVIEKVEKTRKTETANLYDLNHEYYPSEAGFPLGIAEGVVETPCGYFRLSTEKRSDQQNGEPAEYNEAMFADTNTAYIDVDKLSGALSVRTRREGDRFHPVNSKWRMKLKNFFISRRVDAEIRDEIPLVISGGEIVFIPGFVIADEVKLTKSTQRILRIEYLGKKENSLRIN